MSSIFPEPITSLPQADIPLAGIKAFLLQADKQQVVFMEFEEDVELPEHAHAAQVGFVLRGKIELNVNDVVKSYERGDIYCIPADTRHSGRIHAGYADITFFDAPERYRPK
jgi:quercetin dioxygenase-like cupin family protein